MIDAAVVIFGLGQDIWMLNPTQITIVLVVSFYVHLCLRHTVSTNCVLTIVIALLHRRVRIRYRVLSHQGLYCLPLSQDLP